MSGKRVRVSPRASADGVMPAVPAWGGRAGSRGWGDSELVALRLAPPPMQTERGHPGCRGPSLCRQLGQVCVSCLEGGSVSRWRVSVTAPCAALGCAFSWV